mgnify:CR=1 FL=1
MLLVLNNKVDKADRLAYTQKIYNALNKLHIPFISTNKIEDIDLSNIKGIIISGSSIKLSNPEKDIQEKISNLLPKGLKLRVDKNKKDTDNLFSVEVPSEKLMLYTCFNPCG